MVPAKESAAVSKAKNAAKTVKKGVHGRVVKIRTSMKFSNPPTLKLPRKPRYSRKSVPSRNRMDKYRILKSPLTTESAMKRIEDHNTLVFLCDKLANKRQIKQAIKEMYDVKCLKVNTLIR